MKTNFTYILLYLNGIGYSPAETIARSFPAVKVELGQFRGDNARDRRFVATIEAETQAEIDACIGALGAFGARQIDDAETRAILERNLPEDSLVTVINGVIAVTLPQVAKPK